MLMPKIHIRTPRLNHNSVYCKLRFFYTAYGKTKDFGLNVSQDSPDSIYSLTAEYSEFCRNITVSLDTMSGSQDYPENGINGSTQNTGTFPTYYMTSHSSRGYSLWPLLSEPHVKHRFHCFTPKQYGLTQGYTNLGHQITTATKYCAVVSNTYESREWYLLHVTLLVPRIWRWLQNFWKICVPWFNIYKISSTKTILCDWNG
jgi:hypothetical protein